MKKESALQGGKIITAEKVVLPLSRNLACRRCGGLMVQDQLNDPLGSQGQSHFTMFGCLQCGDVVDQVILQHRHAGQLKYPDPSPGTPSSWNRDMALLALGVSL